MKFGLAGFPLGQLGTTVDSEPHETVTRIARAADSYGFDFICAQDHPIAPRAWAEERGGAAAWFDPFVLLSWAAAVTTRVRLVSDVLVLPYRSPFVVAKFGSTLDVMSQGRFVFGLGVGYLEAEFRALGAEFDERGAWTDEAIELIRRCWTEDWVTHSGRFFSADDVAVSPQPYDGPPPIWIGGNSMRALRRAVEFGDGWTPFRGSPDALGAAMQLARDEFGLARHLDVAVPIRTVHAESSEEIDEAAVLARVDALAEAGATHCRVDFRGPTLDGYVRAMERFAERIIGRR